MKAALLFTLLFLCNVLFAESLYSQKVLARLADQDRDGVIDARDRCPSTPEGAEVDNYGCPFENTRLMSVELNVLFDSGKYDVKPQFYAELKSLADFLKNNPKASVVIEGHTDNVGSAELNLDLSQNRASAIADVLTEKFRIPSQQVKGVGYGMDRPIATNETPEGRKINRRVVAEVFARQTSDTLRWTIYSVDAGNTALFSTR